MLPVQMGREPAQAMKNLEKLSQLIRSALAEMRTLLMELRPVALVAGDLQQLVGGLLQAAMARARVQFSYTTHGDAGIQHQDPVALAGQRRNRHARVSPARRRRSPRRCAGRTTEATTALPASAARFAVKDRAVGRNGDEGAAISRPRRGQIIQPAELAQPRCDDLVLLIGDQRVPGPRGEERLQPHHVPRAGGCSAASPTG